MLLKNKCWLVGRADIGPQTKTVKPTSNSLNFFLTEPVCYRYRIIFSHKNVLKPFKIVSY